MASNRFGKTKALFAGKGTLASGGACQKPKNELSVTVEILFEELETISRTTLKIFPRNASIGDAKASIIQPEPVSSRLR